MAPLPPASRRRLPVAVAVVATAALAAAVGSVATWVAMSGGRAALDQPVVKLGLPLPAGDTVYLPENLNFDIARDGRAIAYVAVRGGTGQLFLRPTDSTTGQLLPGTEGALAPFFSPDGRSIGFFARGKLRTIALASSEIRELADAPSGRGGSWGTDGIIYFAPGNLTGILKVPATGGTVSAVTTLNRDQGEVSHRWPQLLPGGKACCFRHGRDRLGQQAGRVAAPRHEWARDGCHQAGIRDAMSRPATCCLDALTR